MENVIEVHNLYKLYRVGDSVVRALNGVDFEIHQGEFCAIAEALLAKGALLGVVLSFMMAVTTLSLPSMIMLRKAVKPKLLGIFVAICTVGIIIVGYFFNAIQYLLV